MPQAIEAKLQRRKFRTYKASEALSVIRVRKGARQGEDGAGRRVGHKAMVWWRNKAHCSGVVMSPVTIPLYVPIRTLGFGPYTNSYIQVIVCKAKRHPE